MEEIWKPLKGIVKNGDNYEVSSMGRVRNKTKGNILVPNEQKTGYVAVTLYLSSKGKLHLIHRLVALAFIPNPEEKPQVNHKNGVKNDNELGNLEWVTRSENQNHAYSTGLQIPARGSKVHGSKLTSDQVAEIKKMIMRGVLDRVIADQYGVVTESIKSIRNGDNWAHVEVEGFTPFTKDNSGSYNFNAKLTDEKVKDIRRLYKEGVYTVRQLASKFGVSHCSVVNIVNYKSWKHVE